MKTRKRESIFVLLLLISATLMVSGCPGDLTDDQGGSGPPGINTNEPQQNEIMYKDVPVNGDIIVTPESRKAAKGEKVTIKLSPNAGYEPYDLAVYDNGNRPVTDLSPAVISSVYEYTFTMPDSMVRIAVNFVPLNSAIGYDTLALSASSDWDRIDALNTLIKKVQNPTSNAQVKAAVLKLNGFDPNATPPLSYPPFPTPTTWDDIGLIRTKMRNTDLTKWLALKYPENTSEQILTGANLANPLLNTINIANTSPLYPDTVGSDLTILFYVKEDNPSIPSISPPGEGWQYGSYPYKAVQDPTGLNILDGVLEIPLDYKIGSQWEVKVPYTVWLWPVAQYTVQYAAGTTGNVILDDYVLTTQFIDKNNNKSVLDEAKTAVEDTISAFILGSNLTLSANNNKGTGYVGSLFGGSAPDRRIYVRIRTEQSNVLLSVKTSSGGFVYDLDGKVLDYIDVSNPGYFYPGSNQYTINVTSKTPPIGM